MDYSAPAEPRWKLAPGSLTNGGNHLCTDDSPAEATTSTPGSLTSGGSHLSVCAISKRSSLPPPYGSEDKTIQAMELEAWRRAALAVWPVPHSRSSPPAFTRLVIILFL
jgi:hypothetical protein